MSPFHQILGNNLVANITNFTVWFGVTFWVYLETRSVFATGMIAGIYLVLTGAFGIWFGSIVDHNAKKTAMLGSSLVSFGFYLVALAALLAFPLERFTNPYGFELWLLVLLVMFGVISGNIRSIALPTLVTMLIPEDQRDKANGLVGMVSGIGFLTTSVISGVLVAFGGMLAVL
ncbi:MAG: MFS transporter, partial [Devosia sp.]